jgi:predicted Zn-dependent protease
MSARGRLRARARTGAFLGAFVLLVALVIGLDGCATNPVTGKKELTLVSESQELEAGKQSLAATQEEYGWYADSVWVPLVDSLGHALASRSHRPDLAWEFHVIDDPTVNAFAAPGGYIFITRGILAHLNSEAQLAGVMGHEIGHVTARHYVRAATREQLAGVGLAVGSIFSSTVARYGGAAQQGLGVLFLKYGRDQESESDRLGVDYALRAGYDPREMPATYHMLARISEKAGARIPTYLSTHPDPGAREETTRELAAQAAGTRAGLRVNRDGYLRSLDGMVYGDDPRNGFFDGATYFHPRLRFTFDVPQGWVHENGRLAVYAGKSDRSVAMQLTLAQAGDKSPETYVNGLVTEGRFTRAEGRTETIHGSAAWVGRLGVRTQSGQEGWLPAVFLRTAEGRTFRLISDATPGSPDEAAFLASARSFRPLTDPARLGAVPARLKVAAAPRAGTFSEVMGGMGAQGAGIEDLAILNGLETGDRVEKGRLLKLVTPAKLR